MEKMIHPVPIAICLHPCECPANFPAERANAPQRTTIARVLSQPTNANATNMMDGPPSRDVSKSGLYDSVIQVNGKRGDSHLLKKPILSHFHTNDSFPELVG